jgi:peroxiredoxin
VRNDAAMTASNRMALIEMRRRTRDEEKSGASLSGYERDKLFLSAHAAQFVDVSGVSGLDDPSDGRAAGFLDYDRDGWLDVALVSSNAPMLKLFHNQIGCRRAGGARVIALRFVGGNHTAQPSSWSARDGYGAQVTVDLGGRTLLREHRAGEGFAAQNSATMVIGLGETEIARSVTVRWPSGRKQTEADVPAGTLVTVYEDAAGAPGGKAFAREPYAKPLPASATAAAPPAEPRLALGPARQTGGARLRLFTTMATWCASCRTELPQLARLRATFTPEQLAMAAVPIDTSESRDLVRAWGAAHKPPYALLVDVTEAQATAVKDLVMERLRLDAVPATFVTDANGVLLLAQWGPPSVSKIRELLARRPAGGAATCAD